MCPLGGVHRGTVVGMPKAGSKATHSNLVMDCTADYAMVDADSLLFH